MEPKRGAIAKCSGGLLGLITCDEPQEVTYNDGNKGVAWVGVQLEFGTIEGRGGDVGKIFQVKPGDPWSSRTPQVLASTLAEYGMIEWKKGHESGLFEEACCHF